MTKAPPTLATTTKVRAPVPSPDVSPFIDLTLYDRDPQDVFEAGITDLQIKLPEWAPREGNTEVLLLEAMALEVAELIFTANRIPSSVVETILKLYGITRDAGEAPTVDLLVTLAGTQGYTIPAGINVRLDLPGGVDPIVFTTGAETVVALGVSTVTLSAVGDRFTAAANGTPAGTLVEMLESIFFIEKVELATAVIGGRDPEFDDTYFERGVQRFSRLSDTLVLPRHFTTYAMENPLVKRAVSIDNYDPTADPDGNGPTGNDPGHVTVAVYGDNVMLTAGEKTDLYTEMDGLALANLAVHVVDPTVTPVDVTVQVQVEKTYALNDVVDNVTAAINDYLSPLTWEWGDVVRRNELISVISSAPGVSYLESMTAPAADIVLPGVANLTTTGTVTITAIP